MKNYREDFPIFNQISKGKDFVYLDNGATTLKPKAVIEAVRRFYEEHTTNVHRSAGLFSDQTNALFDGTRRRIKELIHSAEEAEIIFNHGTTSGFNFLAHSLAPSFLRGDRILLSDMEHHSNIVVWKILSEKIGFEIDYIPVTPTGELDEDAYERLLEKNPKIVSVTQVSNVLGTINPVKEMCQKAHARGALFIVDGAQAVGHMAVDVQDMDADFYLFSGHKFYGPSGVGVLYGKRNLLENLPVLYGGGGSILSVDKDRVISAPLPERFEPGTPPIEGIIGMGEAAQYLMDLGLETVQQIEEKQRWDIEERLLQDKTLRLMGRPRHRSPTFSFNIKGVHPHDVGQVFDEEGVIIRTGKHCAHPLLAALGEASSCRASFAFYNHQEDVERFFKAIQRVKEVMHV